MDTKCCSCCRELKPVSDFRPHLGRKDGYWSKCNQCIAQGKNLSPAPEGTKRCSRCSSVLLLAEFGKASSSKDGYRSTCKFCEAELGGWTHKPHEILPEGQQRCTRCHEIFPATKEWFKIDNRKENGITTWCRKCAVDYSREWYEQKLEDDPEYSAKQYQKHRDYHRAKGREWYINNTERHRESSKKWREENREHVRELDRKRYQKHRDKVIRKSREWRENNKTQYRNYNLEWFKNNPERAVAIRKGRDSRRRARKRQLPYSLKPQQWLYCLEYWEHKCAVCEDVAEIIHADHWIPLSTPNCPGTIAENIVCLCSHCNVTKQAKNPEQWLIEKLGKNLAIQKLTEINAYFEFVINRKNEE